MPDRYALSLHTSLASNTGGPFISTWDRAVVPSTGTLRTAYATASTIASNTTVNRVEIYRQPDAPAGGSNTATTILVDPITLSNTNASSSGTIRAANARVTAGDQLQLRTDMSNVASQPGFLDLRATIEIERD